MALFDRQHSDSTTTPHVAKSECTLSRSHSDLSILSLDTPDNYSRGHYIHLYDILAVRGQ